MQTDMVKGFEKFNASAIQSVKRLSEINMRVFEKLTERQLSLASDCFEGGVKQLEMLGNGKDVQAMVSGQTQFVTEMNELLTDHAKKTAEILTEAKGEYTEWVEEGMKASAITVPFTAPAPKAAKKAA